MLRKQSFGVRKHENIFALGQKQFCFPAQMLLPKGTFPATKAMFTGFQYRSLKMFSSKGERPTMANGKVEVEEPQAEHRKRKR